MKIWIVITGLFVLMLGLAAVDGCGGGSGGTSSPGNGGSTGIARYAIEATKNGVVIDPLNIQVGESIQFLVAGYTVTNVRSVQSASDWQISSGTISSSGQYTATAPDTFSVSATANTNVVSGSGKVFAVQALVAGRLIDGQSNNVAGIKVNFYDAGGNIVGSSTSQSNGNFRASVPTTAVTFDLLKSSFSSAYYKEFQYNSKYYLPPAGVCRPALPSLTNGTTTTLSNILVPPTNASNGASNPPPPPPTGCG